MGPRDKRKAPTGRSGAVLRALQDGPGTVLELAAELELDAHDVRVTLDSLQRSGRVVPARDPNDNRRHWTVHGGVGAGRPQTMYTLPTLAKADAAGKADAAS